MSSLCLDEQFHHHRFSNKDMTDIPYLSLVYDLTHELFFSSHFPAVSFFPFLFLPPYSILHLSHTPVSITVTELILNYLFSLFPEISYKEQTLLSQPINKGTSALLSPSPPHSTPWKTDLYPLPGQHKSHIHTLN